MVRILIDTGADMPKDLREQHNIELVHFPIIFDTETYFDQKDLTTDEFYNKVRDTGIFPKTSQVTTEQFEPAIRKLLEKEDDQVLVITLAASLSGTYSQAVAAKEAIGSDRVTVLDSNMATAMITDLVLDAAEMAEKGMTIEEILPYLEEKKEKREAIFVLDTLEYLRKGGRIGFAASVVGGLMNIKAILKFKDGKIQPFDKAKGKKQALKTIVEYVRNNRVEGNRLLLAHAQNPEFCNEVAALLKEELGEDVDMITEIGPLIGAHTGPGCVFISC